MQKGLMKRIILISLLTFFLLTGLFFEKAMSYHLTSPHLNFPIGINLGDVVEEEGRMYGDGINIAARVESLAEEGYCTLTY
jgi:hypothetical protein